MSDPYNDAVRELFADLRHARKLAGTGGQAVTVRVGEVARGASVELAARASDGRLGDLVFRAWGCPHLLAACEYCCRKLCGSSATALAPLAQDELVRALALPVEKTGTLLLIEDAIIALRKKLDES